VVISLNKAKIKIEFSIKTTDELDKLSHEELLRYIKKLQKNIVQEKPKKNSDNSSIAPSTDINKKKKNQSLYYPRKTKQHFLNRYSKRAKITIKNERIIS